MNDCVISKNLSRIRQQIATCCTRYGRDVNDVNLLAVSKTRSEDLVDEAIAAGQHHFGENYLQEALAKIQATAGTPGEWHYIGAIQSNKTRLIAENFSWVHTVASEKVARRLSDQRPGHLPPLRIMVQINLNDEASKAGIRPTGARSLLAAISGLPGLEIRGLMTIPRPEARLDAQRSNFHEMALLLETLRADGALALPGLRDLSMGMSGDMEAAIAEGATWLRIGTAIFGQREPTNPRN